MSSQGPDFAPRWAVPPSRTVQDVLDERGISLARFATSVGMHPNDAASFLQGDTPISIDLARRLSEVVGASLEFWVTRDCQYRDDLVRVDVDSWLSSLPVKQMVAFGWIDPSPTWHEAVETSFSFFGVDDLDSWRSVYTPALSSARFRSASLERASDAAVAAWLRKAEIDGLKIPVKNWDREGFRDALGGIRGLTRRRDPKEFIPALQERCSAFGVAVVLVRAPDGCPMSGAALHLSDGRALVVLSGRYRSDDHLWFTFFHEAAHLVLHDSDAMFLDEVELNQAPMASHEREADEFAMEILFPADVRALVPRRRLRIRDVVSLARSAGVAPGIVVGQLQHAGVLGFESLNGAKRRYRWAGPTLERV